VLVDAYKRAVLDNDLIRAFFYAMMFETICAKREMIFQELQLITRCKEPVDTPPPPPPDWG
jgi:hypothetical protein